MSDSVSNDFCRLEAGEWRLQLGARAVRLLQQAFREGYYYSVAMHREPAYESLRDYSPFVELMRPKE